MSFAGNEGIVGGRVGCLAAELLQWAVGCLAAGLHRAAGAAGRPPLRHDFAKTIAEVLRGVVIDERVDARVAVHQTVPRRTPRRARSQYIRQCHVTCSICMHRHLPELLETVVREF